MDPSSLAASTSASLLRSLVSATRLTALLDLYGQMRRWWQERHPQGLYEILVYESTVELLDPRGELACIHKHQRVRFLQDNVIAFQDYAWGDGDNFDAYSCSPGVVVDRYKEGDRWNVLISLRESKRRGDVEDFYIERQVREAFLRNEEWCQVEIRHRTQRLVISVIFPQGRPCRKAVLTERSRHRTTDLGRQHWHELPDGRQLLRWETKNVTPLEIYTLKWRW